MNCGRCNSHMNEGAAFCPHCGQASNAGPAGPPARAPSARSFGVAVPAELRGSFILQPGESVWHVWRIADQHVADPGRQPPLSNGYLIVTDQRLVFLKKEGLLSKSYSTTMIIPLERVSGVSAKEGLTLKRSVTVSVEQDGRIMNVVFPSITAVDPRGSASIAPSAAQRIIKGLVENRLHAIAEERRKDRIQYVLDFSFLRAEMEKGGVVVQTIKCPHCGASLELPSAGSSARCTYCGTPVLAQDVFDKMKGIIGTL